MIIRDPIYHQLRQELHQLIQKRDFAVGDKFLTERAVAARFGVSRTTANKALSSLVADNTLEFRKGVGTFVRPVILDYELSTLVSFNDKAVAGGFTPRTKVIAFRRLPGKDAPEPVGFQLAIAPSDGLFYAERLRRADGVPVILERRYIVAGMCARLTRKDLEGSLYAAWTSRHGLDITGADQTIRAVILSPGDAHLLQLKNGDAALAVTALGYVKDGKPLWWEETLYRADAYEFHCRLGRLHLLQPPIGRFVVNKSSKKSATKTQSQ